MLKVMREFWIFPSTVHCSEYSMTILSYFSSEKDLKEFEKLYNIKRRWDLSADGVKELVCEVIDTERIELVRSLRIMAFERSFLLSLKRKYAGIEKQCIALVVKILFFRLLF